MGARAGAAVLGTLLGSGLLAASAVAVPVADHRTAPDPKAVRVSIGTLPKGPPPRMLYAEHKVIHDGAHSVEVTLKRSISLVGRVRGGYVVQTLNPSGFRAVLWRVERNSGALTRLGLSFDPERPPRIFGGGRLLAYNSGSNPIKFAVRDAETGDVVARRQIAGWGEVIDAAVGRVLIGFEHEREDGPNGQLLWWFPRSGRTEVIRDDFGVPHNADALNGLALVVPTDAPRYVELIDTDQPNEPLWRSKRVFPLAFAPDGSHTLSVNRRAFGNLGLRSVQVRRTADNTLVRVFRGGVISPVHWDGNRHFVMVVWESGRVAAVRCSVGGKCARVSEVIESPAFIGASRLGWTFPNSSAGIDYSD